MLDAQFGAIRSYLDTNFADSGTEKINLVLTLF